LTLRPGDLRGDLIRRARLLHVDAVEEEVALRAALIARQAGLQVTSDIDRVTPRTAELVAAVTVPMFAEHVAETLTGEPTLERALRAVRRTHDGLLCATLGARGAVLLAGGELVEAAAYRVDTVDTTGAGDVFRGAFIYALLRGDAPVDILRFANAAAAISCTRAGAIGGVPTLDEIEALMTTAARSST
jgi:sugar/nucleoside kinase (ribokinase family)